MSNLPPLPPRPNFNKPTPPQPEQPPLPQQPPLSQPTPPPAQNYPQPAQPAFPPPVAAPTQAPYNTPNFAQAPQQQQAIFPTPNGTPVNLGPVPPKNNKGLIFGLIGGGAFLLVLMIIGGIILVNGFMASRTNPPLANPANPSEETPISPETPNSAAGESYRFDEASLTSGESFSLAFSIQNPDSTIDPEWVAVGAPASGLASYESITTGCYLTLYQSALPDVELIPGNDEASTHNLLEVALEGAITSEEFENESIINTITTIDSQDVEVKQLGRTLTGEGSVVVAGRAFSDVSLGFVILMSCDGSQTNPQEIWADVLTRTEFYCCVVECPDPCGQG